MRVSKKCTCSDTAALWNQARLLAAQLAAPPGLEPAWVSHTCAWDVAAASYLSISGLFSGAVDFNSSYMAASWKAEVHSGMVCQSPLILGFLFFRWLTESDSLKQSDVVHHVSGRFQS